jgi:transposase, IS5 family
MQVIEPYYHKSGKRGRLPMRLERMLCTYFVQQWCCRVDEAVEDAVYDLAALRNFMGIDLIYPSVPDATTLMRFRHLLEAHHLGLSHTGRDRRYAAGVGLVDNARHTGGCHLNCDTEFNEKQSVCTGSRNALGQKRNQWYSSTKAHIGANKRNNDCGLVHTLTTKAAIVSDISQTVALLHEQERDVWADAGYFCADCHSGSAKRFFGAWAGSAMRRRLEPVKNVIRMLRHHESGSLTYSRHRIGNACAEGFANAVELIKASLGGFRTFTNYRLKIQFRYGKKHGVLDPVLGGTQ